MRDCISSTQKISRFRHLKKKDKNKQNLNLRNGTRSKKFKNIFFIPELTSSNHVVCLGQFYNMAREMRSFTNGSPQPSETHFEVDALFRLFLCSHLYPNVMTREESNLSFFTFHVIDAIRVLSVYWAKTDQVLGSSPKYYDGVCFSFSGLESSW